MRISFRQGIVSAPNAFLQANGATVNLSIASPSQVLVAFADGTANYLHTERSTVTSAWVGPFSSGTNYWLYWDINPVSGVRTFGHTLLEPVEAASAPLSPANDQHWFDTNLNKMKVWNTTAGRWVNKIRVFAGQYLSGTTFVSMSINAPDFTGTQVGSLVVPVDAGALMFDLNGDPVKRNGGAFFTTSDVVTASLASASQVKVGAVVIEAVAVSNIPAYSIVNFSGFHEVTLTAGLMQAEAVYGLVEVDAVIGDVVNVILDGVVTNPDWDWTAVGVNAPLYVDNTGVLTATQPTGGVAVAAVVDVNSILVRPLLQTVTITTGTPLVVRDEGVLLTGDASQLNFVGAGVTATNTLGAVTVTIPGGAGATPPQVFALTSQNTDFFDEIVNFGWTFTPQTGFTQPAYLSFDTYGEEFTFSQAGTYVLTLHVRAVGTFGWPSGNSALGTTVTSVSGVNIAGVPTTVHHRGSIGPFDVQPDVMTWVDRHVVSATAIGATMAIGAYAGSYGNSGTEVTFQVTATIERVNDPFVLA